MEVEGRVRRFFERAEVGLVVVVDAVIVVLCAPPAFRTSCETDARSSGLMEGSRVGMPSTGANRGEPGKGGKPAGWVQGRRVGQRDDYLREAMLKIQHIIRVKLA